jgi:hypothetical protein
MSGHRRAHQPLVTGSFPGQGWAGRLFILLKAGQFGPKSRNQVEIGVALLPKIAGIVAKITRKPKKRRVMVVFGPTSQRYG